MLDSWLLDADTWRGGDDIARNQHVEKPAYVSKGTVARHRASPLGDLFNEGDHIAPADLATRRPRHARSTSPSKARRACFHVLSVSVLLCRSRCCLTWSSMASACRSASACSTAAFARRLTSPASTPLLTAARASAARMRASANGVSLAGRLSGRR